MNTGAPWPTAEEAETRVREIQTKLHQRACTEPSKGFEDLANLVADPAFLVVAWRRVKGNRGAGTAGVDGHTAAGIAGTYGEEHFLRRLRADLKSRRFQPLPVRERSIPKAGGKRRRLGIPTVKDRAVQASLKLVLEPIFEADFRPSSYGFRPARRAHDAVAEIHHLCSRTYEWIVDADIAACFDEIDHAALMERVRRRIKDRRVLALIKAFLKAGILGEDGAARDRGTGTPQGGILSPLLANIALSPLDEAFAEAGMTIGSTGNRRQIRRRQGLANYRLVRYADDFVILVAGTQAQAEELRDRAAWVLRPMGLRLSDDKTRITHIDRGLDFLGFRIQRQRKPGSWRRYVYIYPTKAALAAVKARVRDLTQGATNPSLTLLIHWLNPVLRGWTSYFRHASSSRTFSYLRAFVWRRVVCWLRHKHKRATWQWLRRHYLPGWWPAEGAAVLFNPGAVRVKWYRYRAHRLPSPWESVGPGGQLHAAAV